MKNICARIIIFLFRLFYVCNFSTKYSLLHCDNLHVCSYFQKPSAAGFSFGAPAPSASSNDSGDKKDSAAAGGISFGATGAAAGTDNNKASTGFSFGAGGESKAKEAAPS